MLMNREMVMNIWQLKKSLIVYSKINVLLLIAFSITAFTHQPSNMKPSSGMKSSSSMKPSNIQARTLPPAPQDAERNASLEMKNFYSDSYPQIREKYRDGHYIVSLWSTTCAPCFEELEMLGQWRVHHPNVPIILI